MDHKEWVKEFKKELRRQKEMELPKIKNYWPEREIALHGEFMKLRWPIQCTYSNEICQDTKGNNVFN